MQQTTAVLPALVTALALLVTGCVTETPVEPVSVDTEKRAEVSGEIELGRALQDLDRRIDKYVFWRSQPGEDAARERYVERSAAVSIVRLHQDALIRTAADRSEPARRRIAAKALGFATDPSAVRTLVDLLGERGDPRLLTNAAFALAELRSPSVPGRPLIDLLGLPDADVRNNALLALFHSMEARRSTGGEPLPPIERAEAVPLIEAALFDPDDHFVRGHAAACLGALGDPRSVDALINVLPDPNPFVRTRAALALGKIGDVKAVPALVAVIDETPRGTPRSAVTTALRVILERAGRQAPPGLEASERAWNAFLRQRLGPDVR